MGKWNYLKMSKYVPDLLVDKLDDINLLTLKEKGINYLLVDVDNTLVDLRSEEPTSSALIFLEKAIDNGIHVILISNNFKKRVSSLADRFKVPYISFALKPFPFLYKRIMKKYKVTKNELAAIGDQIFTDIAGAKNMGIYAIYVKPFSDNDRLTTKVLRKLERRILK